AINYGNLGNVYLTRGDLDKAEEMYRKSLNISEALGLKEASANCGK
ncbi:MAG: tetratricopeptide repeat protein, partial [Candidatus Electrothrix sp. AX1]|nr:tetratricopeptide repeat protein [Candidatus Electrothrix sp. AX1]